MSAHDAFEEAAASYALGALEGADREAFERHLPGCERCQAELVDLQRVTAGLNLAVDSAPLPGSLKARTITRAIAQPRSGGDVIVAESPEVPSADATVAAHEEPSQAVVYDERQQATEARRSFGWSLAAAWLLAAGLGGYALSLRSQVQTLATTVAELSDRVERFRAEAGAGRGDSVRLANVMEVLRAPDTVRLDLRGQGETPFAVGRAYVSQTHGLVFSVDRLPSLVQGRVYQIWLIPPGRSPLSAGVFTVGATGTYDIALPLPAGATVVRGLAVTVEPGPNGSPQGTTPPVLLGLGTE